MKDRTSALSNFPLKIETDAPDILDNSEKVCLPTVSVPTDTSKAKLEELTSLQAEIDKLYNSYFQCHLLLSAVKEAACETNSKFPLIIQKVQQIIASEKVASIANLNFGKSNHESLMILGLEDSHMCGSSTVLSYGEKINLKSLVEEKLLKNCSRIQNCISTGGNLLTIRIRF
jgi:hypothetical protein